MAKETPKRPRKTAETPLQLKSKTTDAFSKKLCQWYYKNQRQLPWRLTPTPYRVWISEIMLQQTQVKAVIPYYDRFLKRFPDISSLAMATEEEILTHWSGLGYYSRAKNLRKAAREIMDFHNGKFPMDHKTIVSLPGIGRYTAGAICSIAWNQPQPVVDGNIRRVTTRLRGIRKYVPEKFFWDQMTVWIPERNASMFNQAMMELGATICLPARPLCSQCPVHTYCQAKRNNLQNRIPLPRPGKSARNIELLILILKCKRKFLLIRQEDGFIPGTWGLPCTDISQKQPLMKAAVLLYKKLCGGAIAIDYHGMIRHSITNHRILAHIFMGEIKETASQFHIDDGRSQWVNDTQLGRMLTSSLFRKALKACQKDLQMD